MNIKSFIDNSDPDDDNSLAEIRCGSCSNSLVHCGNYSISTLEGGKYEGLLCQDCLKAGRKVLNAIVISDSNKITYIELPKEQSLKQQQEKIEKPKPQVMVKAVKKDDETSTTKQED